MTPRLIVRNLTKTFESTTVVDDVSLALRPGQVTCLLGPSGCGKSTTLRMIAGLEHPDSGEITLDNHTLLADGLSVPPEHRGIGLMFQDFALFPHMSVADNIAFGLRDAGSAKAQEVERLLSYVRLEHLRDQFPHALSGGEQQRIALVRALAAKPKVMLMDEPFSGLDNRLRDAIRDETLAVLKEAQTSVILVTHEPEEAMRMADEIALMRHGKIVQSGAPYNIYNAPKSKYALSFFSDINVLRAKVEGALADTPFGRFLAPGLADGTEVEIAFRPQHVRIDFDRAGKGPNPTASNGVPARARVARARFLGCESLVEFVIEATGDKITASIPNVFLPEAGRALWLTVPRKRCFVFPEN